MVLPRMRTLSLTLCITAMALVSTLLGCTPKAEEQAETAPEALLTHVPEPVNALETTAEPQEQPAVPEQPQEAEAQPADQPEADVPERVSRVTDSLRELVAEKPKLEKPKPVAAKKPDKPAPAPKKPPAPARPAALKAGARSEHKPDPGPTQSAPEVSAEKPGETTVLARIEVVSHVPDPSEVPYTDCVTFIKYKVESVESGEYNGNELLGVHWGMKDSKLQPAAKLSVGQRQRLTIRPFSERKDLTRVMQADDTDEYSLTPYWVTKASGM